MAQTLEEWLAQQDQGGLPAPTPGGNQSNPYQQMNGSQTRAAGSMNNISPGPPVGTPNPVLGVGVPVPGRGSGYIYDPNTGGMVPPIPMSAQDIALMIATNTPQSYQPGMAGPTEIFGVQPGSPAGSSSPVNAFGAGQTNVPGMPAGIPGSMNPRTAQNIALMLATGVPSMYGGSAGKGTSFDPASQADAILSSGLPVNESELAQYIYSNPQLAISMGGVAQPGTPGFNNLANLGFDPMAIFIASGGDPGNTNSAQYAQWLANFYSALGTPGNQGGGSVNAGALLVNMLNMGSNTELGIMMSEDPTVFSSMANQVMQASGTSPFAQQAFKSQIAQLMLEYMQYASSKKSGEIIPINEWIKTNHPEIVASWTGAGG